MKNRTAMITGGVRGIGRAVAEEFCKRGANVFICYRSNDEAAKETEQHLAQYGTKVLTVKADVADFASVEAAVKKAKEEFDAIDILVNNAGITNDKLLMRMTEEDFTKVIDVNLNGAFNCLRQVAPLMIKKKYGRIINLSSIVGVKGSAGQVNYGASKAGVIGLTLSAAKELGSRGITVNAIAPGFIESDMTGVLNEEYQAKLISAITAGRIGTPEDVAFAAAFLASERASYITGQVIGVDGGMMA